MVWKFLGEMGFLRQVEQGFSVLFAECFGKSDDFSQWSIPKALQNFEKLSNMPKIWQKMKKSLVQLALKTHFSMALPKPDPSLSVTHSTNTV